VIRAALFDLGGVVFTSPFEAFDRYERERGLPEGFIRGLNTTNPDTNAWARLERAEVTLDQFCALFESEARAAGGRLDGRDVLTLLAGDVREEMVEAIRRCRTRLKTAAITNNWVVEDDGGRRIDDLAGPLFDVVLESSKIGMRKPDPRVYQLACEQLEVEPAEAVFLDDIGANLKPARAIGMTTIKFTEQAAAIAELEQVVGFALQ
jgi:putative hydrolase of the HAD superfamily